MSKPRRKTPKLPRSFTSAPSLSLDDLLLLPPDQIPKIDIALVNLLCAQGLPGAKNLNIDQYLLTLDRWAKHVRQETKRHEYRIDHPKFADHYNRSPARFKMEMLCQTLQEDFGVHYNHARIHQPDFRNAKDLFIHGMIDDKNGDTCASMPVLYTAIARRLNYPVRLVAAKGHLFCRWDGKKERMNFEGSSNGGCSFKDDGHYRNFPTPITDAEFETTNYLQSQTRREELAGMLASRGYCLDEHDRLKDAEKCYRRSIELDPRCPSYRGSLINSLVKQEAGDIDRSRKLTVMLAHPDKVKEIAKMTGVEHQLSPGCALRVSFTPIVIGDIEPDSANSSSNHYDSMIQISVAHRKGLRHV